MSREGNRVEETKQPQLHNEETEALLMCPICNLHAGRLRRGKLYCGNCGFIES